jgi:hypothetical protein
VAVRPDGEIIMAGHTDGRVSTSAGGTDVFAYRLSPRGPRRIAVTAATQFGTAQRDGADEWDEANLYLAVAPTGTPWVTGLTFGSADGKSNSGAGDVFLGPLPVIDHHAQM